METLGKSSFPLSVILMLFLVKSRQPREISR